MVYRGLQAYWRGGLCSRRLSVGFARPQQSSPWRAAPCIFTGRNFRSRTQGMKWSGKVRSIRSTLTACDVCTLARGMQKEVVASQRVGLKLTTSLGGEWEREGWGFLRTGDFGARAI
ncbi:unnamed protein product, partial [Choristocarpus tenellus]